MLSLILFYAAIALGAVLAVPVSLFIARHAGSAGAAALAIICLALPALAFAQSAGDAALVNGAVSLVVDRWPGVASYLAVVPFLQLGAAGLARLVKRSHSTWLHTGLTRFAMFPILAPPPAAKPEVTR